MVGAITVSVRTVGEGMPSIGGVSVGVLVSEMTVAMIVNIASSLAGLVIPPIATSGPSTPTRTVPLTISPESTTLNSPLSKPVQASHLIPLNR